MAVGNVSIWIISSELGADNEDPHTYLDTDFGVSVGCLGTREDGECIHRFTADRSLVQEASEPNGTTGLTFGINGFCHTAIKRMLARCQEDIPDYTSSKKSIYEHGDYGYDENGEQYSPLLNPWNT